ncbi:MAG TPA: OmpA family protein [Chitinophagaceae bacterium]|nr:OmpA family protein [Chitinophagaceae bacterium]
MKKSPVLITLLFISLFTYAQDENPDAPGCKDSPMFTRMPNTVIGECSSNYDEVEIPMGTDNNVTKEGTKTYFQYTYNLEEATAPSFFQILKNFENAIVKTGGKRIYYSKEAGVATLFTRSGGKDIWVVLNDGSGAKAGNFALTILEIEGMKQDISANIMLDSLKQTGSITLHINFETGKSVIKPESQSIVDQMAEMLNSDPSIKISIEGHTDNVGTAAANQTLSQNRAKAVMDAIIAKGIDKARLSSKGWGQNKPVADNSTEEGRAMNRRVEIVKQ